MPFERRIEALVKFVSLAGLAAFRSNFPFIVSSAEPVSSTVKVCCARNSTETNPVISAVNGPGSSPKAGASFVAMKNEANGSVVERDSPEELEKRIASPGSDASEVSTKAKSKAALNNTRARYSFRRQWESLASFLFAVTSLNYIEQIQTPLTAPLKLGQSSGPERHV